MIKKITYFDNDTGDIYSDKTMIVKSSYNGEKGYLFWNRKNASKTFKSVHFPSEMSFDDIGRLTVLTKYVFGNTNMIGYRSNGIIKAYSITQIAEFIKLSERFAIKYIRKLIRLGVMAKIKIVIADKIEIQYYINPIYFFSANWLPIDLYMLFKEQLDTHLPKWVIKKFQEQNN